MTVNHAIIAESLKRTNPAKHAIGTQAEYLAAKEQWRRSVKDITLMLKRTNKNFNYKNFLIKCGITITE